MGDQLEKFVIENRVDFDDPVPGNSWNSIESRLAGKTRKLHVLWKATAVIFMISTSYLIADKVLDQPDDPQYTSDFIQAEDYYVSLINERRTLIQESLTPEQTDEFLMEIDQLDAMYSELKKTYTVNATNERIMNAMISNLQLRLDILNRQLEILESIKNQNNENDTILEI